MLKVLVECVLLLLSRNSRIKTMKTLNVDHIGTASSNSTQCVRPKRQATPSSSGSFESRTLTGVLAHATSYFAHIVFP
jgi:hypothetical protein